MRCLLVLVRGSTRVASLRDLQGRSIFAGLPFHVVALVERRVQGAFETLEGDVETRVVSWHDPERAMAVAEEVARAHDVFGVATLEEDLMDVAGAIRARLRLGGMGPDEVSRVRDKVLMKRLVSRAGLRVPAFVSCTDPAAAHALLARAGTLVLKPVRGQGSRDVAFVKTPAELDAWYANTPDARGFEAEEFIEGTLYHVNAVIRDGEPVLTASALYVPGMGNIDFPSGAPFVSVMEDDPVLSRRLTAFSREVIYALDLRQGVTHLECFLTPSGEIVFCEIALRPGGGGIAWMIEAQYGLHYPRTALLLEAGLGAQLAIPVGAALESGGVAGLIGFRTAASGFVQQIASPSDFSEPWIRVCQIEVARGTFKPASAHCTDFTGLLVFTSRDHAEFHARRAELEQRFESVFRTSPMSGANEVDLHPSRESL